MSAFHLLSRCSASCDTPWPRAAETGNTSSKGASRRSESVSSRRPVRAASPLNRSTCSSVSSALSLQCRLSQRTHAAFNTVQAGNKGFKQPAMCPVGC